MVVQQDGQLPFDAVLDAFDDPVGIEGHQDAGGILERQPVGADLHELLGVLHPLLQGVHRTDGVVHLDVRFAAEIFDGLGRRRRYCGNRWWPRKCERP